MKAPQIRVGKHILLSVSDRKMIHAICYHRNNVESWDLVKTASTLVKQNNYPNRHLTTQQEVPGKISNSKKPQDIVDEKWQRCLGKKVGSV